MSITERERERERKSGCRGKLVVQGKKKKKKKRGFVGLRKTRQG